MKENQIRKEILAVSFGTSFAETREKTIGAIERRIEKEFPECRVRRCFTSRMIRKKLLERDGIHIDSPEEAVQSALKRGVENLTVQPLYLMHGQEHHRLMEILRPLDRLFGTLAVGRPLLSSEEDFRTIAEAIRTHLPASDPETALVLMGHGTGPGPEKRPAPRPVQLPDEPQEDASRDGIFRDSARESREPGLCGKTCRREEEKDKTTSGHVGPKWNVQGNYIYRILQDALRDTGADQYYIATVEGEPTLEDILPRICERDYRRIVLAPLMIVAGDHAVHDLAGDSPESWKSIFLQKGFEVRTALQGIGEWIEVQDLFARHAADAQIC